MCFSLVLINHPRHGLITAYDDVILPLSFAFRRLGYEVEFLRHRINPNRRNILFGTADDPNLIGLEAPPDSIIFNLERLSADSGAGADPVYLDHLRRLTVWDCARNLEFLAARDIQAAALTLGYVPEMTRLRRDVQAEYDVLFYDPPSPRQQAVLDDLKKTGGRAAACDGALWRNGTGPWRI